MPKTLPKTRAPAARVQLSDAGRAPAADAPQLGYSEKAARRLAEVLCAYKHALGEDEVG